jgi:hypothetical protein
LSQLAQPTKTKKTNQKKTQPKNQAQEEVVLRNHSQLQTKKHKQPKPNSHTTSSGKLKYNLKTLSSIGLGELGNDSAERTAKVLSTLRNLNQVILAEGKK